VEEAAPAAAAADAALQEHTQQQQLDAEVLAASLMPMDLPMGPITARVFVADRQASLATPHLQLLHLSPAAMTHPRVHACRSK
jgi:hypothetical protein